LWVSESERAAGVTMALLAMVKPQFGLLLLWTALRRRWSALISGIATLAVGTAVSVAAFGLHNNLDYLRVLSGLSREAQSHYANQSMFGLLNRAIFNGENLPYHPYVYPPFVPWVYYATLATTAALILLVLAYPWRRRAGTMADMGAMGVVCVIATPMAWEHHYGVLLGIFVWLWFAAYRAGYGRPVLLAAAWILIADFLSGNACAQRAAELYVLWGAAAARFADASARTRAGIKKRGGPALVRPSGCCVWSLYIELEPLPLRDFSRSCAILRWSAMMGSAWLTAFFSVGSFAVVCSRRNAWSSSR